MVVQWIALRIIREIVRDRRTLAFFFLVPVVVMSLIYYALLEDEQARLGILSRGAMRLFEYDLVTTLEEEKDVLLLNLDIDDEETDQQVLETSILNHLKEGKLDGILYFDEQLLVDRFSGERGTLYIYLEGSRPTKSAALLEAIASAMDELASAMPVVIDASCSAFCADSINNKPMDLEKRYLYGSDDLRLIDFFLPVFPPFFVFFFTFILSTITFQRERVRGTLERLLIAPVSFAQVILGYLCGFFIFSSCQAAIILIFILALLGFQITFWQIVSLAIITAAMILISLVIGLTASFLATNEFQALQFIPLVILPQIFLSDMIWGIDGFPMVFQWISKIMPLTYANDAMRNVLLKNQSLWQCWDSMLALTVMFFSILGLLILIAKKQQHSKG